VSEIQSQFWDLPPTPGERAEASRAKLRQEDAPAGRIEHLSEAAGRMRTVLIDPPWPYHAAGWPSGGVAHHYATMSTDELAAMPVPSLAHPDGCLFWIWTTWPMIRDGVAHEVLKSWGQRWVGEVVWEKPGLGPGQWLRPATEILTLSVTGKPRLMETTGLRAHFTAERGRHSEKPDFSYEFVERVSPPPRLEMFSRKARAGWLRWGDEA
jgi:N6-adenosine-specific RNA methylase IME4